MISQSEAESVSSALMRAVLAGDADAVGEVYADASKAEKLLGWTAQHSIEDMCRDSWNWQSRNPRGYE